MYTHYIREQTKAEFDETINRWRSSVRTWEHFLWLASKLDVLASDNIVEAEIVLPPNHIIDEDDAPKSNKLQPGEELAMAAYWMSPRTD
ncbi:MAG: hypothetical protein AAFR21_16080 [Pseudomonadota bacterium]